MKKNTKDILETLSSGPVQKFILDNQHSNVQELVLRNKVLFNIPVANLSDQIGTRRKAKDKLPLFYDTGGIVYPPSVNFEQSSSQQTARYKSQLMTELLSEAVICADLTGGFGVDAFFFSERIKSVHYVEPERSLLELAQHNHRLLGARNIHYHHSTAEAFLDSTSLQFDFLFVDPSRRAGTGQKVAALSESTPDVIGLKDAIFSRTANLLVKASPLFDLQAGISQLSGVKQVHVVSVDNECRELLFFCNRNFTGEPTIVATNLRQSQPAQIFQFSFEEERTSAVSCDDPFDYLYEPNASILKAGAFKSIARQYHLKKLSPNTHLYSSTEKLDDFPGRVFAIEKFVKPDSRDLRQYFPDGKANVATRNYPLTPDALRKKTRLKDGGDKYLLGFSGQRKKFLVVARRL